MTDVNALHTGEREAILEANAEQARELYDQNAGPLLTCPCGSQHPIRAMYQCFFCGVFFCKRCAGVHFEDGGGDGE